MKPISTTFLVALFLLSLLSSIQSQNTVGLIDLKKDAFSDGYNLFYPHNQSSVYLIDNCGEIVHTWTDDDDFRPGNMAYLLDDGRMVRCKRPNVPTMDSIWAGGGGAYIDIIDWDSNILYQFFQNDSLRRLHHDVAMLPNGNILAISWELKTGAEAIQAGRDPSILIQNKLWPDYILELDPEKDSIVWEWHVWDHLIQDFDPSKDNFGVVGNHPELVDINWQTNDGFPDWMHSNAIDYNAELDQILLCVPTFNEVWIIDHSTTTEEASGHTGGRSGKGGDLLWRWGNPAAYRASGNQQLFYPHDVHWVEQFLDTGHPDFGKIAVFNNRVGPDYSSVHILNPSFDPATGNYQTSIEGYFLPDDFEVSIVHPDTFSLHSTGLSSVQIMENRNLLVCSGRWGRVFEFDRNTSEVVWEYTVPLKGGSPVEQGTELSINNNLTFRFTRYPVDYAPFSDKDLSPKGYLELNPNEDLCDLLTPVNETIPQLASIYPNPTRDQLQVVLENDQSQWLQMISLTGQVVYEGLIENKAQIDVSHLAHGIYLITIDHEIISKVVVQ